ncbi:hypothetical protein Pen01_41640 [Phytomonospora endophytica]|nr:hypothetical protein Pen01_41640 [Phytomonospora endophytica]
MCAGARSPRSGKLLWYRINGPGDRQRFELKSSTWGGFGSLLPPGGGVYFGHEPDGAMKWCLDHAVGDGDGPPSAAWVFSTPRAGAGGSCRRSRGPCGLLGLGEPPGVVPHEDVEAVAAGPVGLQ